MAVNDEHDSGDRWAVPARWTGLGRSAEIVL